MWEGPGTGVGGEIGIKGAAHHAILWGLWLSLTAEGEGIGQAMT